MKPIAGVYGIESYKEWFRRLRTPGRPGIRDLSDTKHDSGLPSLEEPSLSVGTYSDLADIVSFLAVMNKNLTLIFRGQIEDHDPLPALLRPSWSPDPRRGDIVELSNARVDFYRRLNEIGDSVVAVLDRHGLPRYQHMQFRYARWAVIQHYELLPTPMMDFTTSLRVAASFAFGLDPAARRGFLYITGTRHLRSDLMTFDRDEAAGAEHSDGVMTVRLNSVCPPRARRPHLQEGVLACLYPFDEAALDPDKNNFLRRTIAKIELVNSGNFWSPDFPIHTHPVLLPALEDDELLQDLHSII